MKALLAVLLLMGALVCAPANANPTQVEFRTSAGSFVVELFPERAPKTVQNFLQYVNSGHYQGTIFHRVIEKFIVQGGGYNQDMQLKSTFPPIPIESDNGLKNERGTVAMARGFQPDTATSQFFINLDNNKTLNYYKPDPALMGYTVFGRVIKGLDVLDRISHIPTRSSGKATDVPVETIVIEQVALLETPIQAEAPEPASVKAASKKTSPSKKKDKISG